MQKTAGDPEATGGASVSGNFTDKALNQPWFPAGRCCLHLLKCVQRFLKPVTSGEGLPAREGMLGRGAAVAPCVGSVSLPSDWLSLFPGSSHSPFVWLLSFHRQQ